mmetsp:Transcript_20203/g.51394  ORF Transcript_20203/g.51394 Transcript_20203/m.51394 type:complete len:1018 (-) Transcript_20203:123-3176(-)
MDFATARGACEVVAAEDAGERLQRFAARAFREQLLQRGDSRTQAFLAASEGRLLVNDAVVPGSHVLRASDVVTLVSRDVVTLVPPTEQAAQGRSARRMVVELEDGDEDGDGAGGMRQALAASAGALAFREYYAAQRLCTPAQWDAAFSLLVRPLPLSVRINLASELHGLASAEVRAAGLAVGAGANPIPWMPAGSAFQFEPGAGASQLQPGAGVEAAAGFGGDVQDGFGGDAQGGFGEDARAVSAASGGGGSSLAELVSRAAATGELCQQEAASMLPPALLAPILATDAILDLCSAPASKSSQLLDMMVAASRRGATGCSQLGTGVLIANDLERPRAERALRRLWAQHSSNAIVTCGDARLFQPPFIFTSDQRWLGGASSSEPICGGGAGGVGGSVTLQFDRILVDAPCSGDGTVRKTPQKWTKWSPAPALSNHPLQVAILTHALGLLKNGGKLVYSTCSLNPIECEAVVGAAIRAANSAFSCQGSESKLEFELLSALDALPPSARGAITPGVSEWLVPVRDSRGVWVQVRTMVEAGLLIAATAAAATTAAATAAATDTVAAAATNAATAATSPPVQGVARRRPSKRLKIQQQLQPPPQPQPQLPLLNMFPTSDESEIDLRRCARILPTAADCGAFFSALITRRVGAPEFSESPGFRERLPGLAGAPGELRLPALSAVENRHSATVANGEAAEELRLPALADALFAPLHSLCVQTEAELREFFGLRPEFFGGESTATATGGHGVGVKGGLEEHPGRNERLALAVCVTDAMRAAISNTALNSNSAPRLRVEGKADSGQQTVGEGSGILPSKEIPERFPLLELAPLVVCVPPSLLRLSRSKGCPLVLGGGIPAFAKMPPGCQWPAERPWRICQQAASLLGEHARKRVLGLPAAQYLQLLSEQRIGCNSEEVTGWSGCLGPDGNPEMGALVVGLLFDKEGAPGKLKTSGILLESSMTKRTSSLFVAAVLVRSRNSKSADGGYLSGLADSELETGGCELELVASADVARRYEEIARRSCQI